MVGALEVGRHRGGRKEFSAPLTSFSFPSLARRESLGYRMQKEWLHWQIKHWSYARRRTKASTCSYLGSAVLENVKDVLRIHASISTVKAT